MFHTRHLQWNTMNLFQLEIAFFHQSRRPENSVILTFLHVHVTYMQMCALSFDVSVASNTYRKEHPFMFWHYSSAYSAHPLAKALNFPILYESTFVLTAYVTLSTLGDLALRCQPRPKDVMEVHANTSGRLSFASKGIESDENSESPGPVQEVLNFLEGEASVESYDFQ